MLCGELLSGANNFLMSSMHTIEDPDRKRHRAGDRAEIANALEHFHGEYR
jgi:hypothetical protein